MKQIIKNEKIVGHITTNKKCYITYRDPEIHLFKKFNGYGISKDILNQLEWEQVINIVIHTPQGDHLFKLEDFTMSHLEWSFEGDEQKFVSIY